jgi:hypothetical protein
VRRASITLFVLAAAAAVPAVAAAQPAVFTLTVSPTAGTAADEYIATVVVRTAGVGGLERFYPPEFGDFSVLDQRTQQSTQWTLNSATQQHQVSNETLYKFILRPTRTGKLKIGPAKVKLDGQIYESKGAIVEVVDAGNAPTAPVDRPGLLAGSDAPPAKLAGRRMFLWAALDKPRVYVGEQVTVTWILYTVDEVLKFDPQVPKLQDLASVKLYEPQRFLEYHEDAVGEQAYLAAVVYKQAVFPTKAGKISVPAYAADVSTMYTAFGQPQRLASPALNIEAMPLPDGAPAGFDPSWVGQYAITASVDRDTVPAGESSLLTLTVKGTGAVQRMRIPSLTFENFQVFPPRDFDEKVEPVGDAVHGERRYQYLLTPTKGGKQQIGPIEMTYFDPTAGRFEVARAEAIPISVIGDPAAIAGATGIAGAEHVVTRDIRPEHAPPPLASRAVARARSSPYFWITFGVPPVVWVLVIFVDKLRERMRRETPRARLRRARGRARKRLRVAELHIRGQRTGKFFGELARVLNEHIEERVGEPVAAMTREQLRDFLPRRGFPQETVDALVRELENCDFARFAPSASGPGEMRSALRRVRALLTAIERVRPPALEREAA